MSKVALRPATELDREFVALVTEACMRGYVELTWGHWQSSPPEDFQPAIHQIIQCDGDEIGCVALLEEAEALMLKTFYILPSHQNRDIGAFLMREIIERARASGKPIQLRVLCVNPARRFYERHGFVVTRSTDERHFMSCTASSL
jgi:GNAT superfamily N-acetyltransferase